MADEKQYEKIQQGIGTIIAMSKIIYDNAIRVGFTDEQALMLSTAYMTNVFQEAREVAYEQEKE